MGTVYLSNGDDLDQILKMRFFLLIFLGLSYVFHLGESARHARQNAALQDGLEDAATGRQDAVSTVEQEDAETHRQDAAERNGLDAFLNTVGEEVEKMEETKEVAKDKATEQSMPATNKTEPAPTAKAGRGKA